jgi:hypothetical protein
MMKPALDMKTPNEEKDYGINWAAQLAADVAITGSTWTIETTTGSPDLAIEDDGIDGMSTVVRLSGGSAGLDYLVSNTITTSDGESLEQGIEVRVRSVAVASGIF